MKKRLLSLSVAANIALLICCTYLLLELKSVYSDYRYFRALPVGSSDASLAKADSSAESNPEVKTVVLFGDSRIDTWNPLPQTTQYQFINAGVSGETTTEMRRRFTTDVLRLSPDLVVIQAGVNDLTAAATRGIPEPAAIIEGMHNNMNYFLTTLAANNIKVTLTSIIQVNTLSVLRRVFWSSDLAQTVVDSNKRLEALAKKTNAEWLDINPLFQSQTNEPVTSVYQDTVHLNDAGYRKLNQRLLQHLASSHVL